MRYKIKIPPMIARDYETRCADHIPAEFYRAGIHFISESELHELVADSVVVTTASATSVKMRAAYCRFRRALKQAQNVGGIES